MLREVRNRAVGDKVLCALRGEKLSFGRYSFVGGNVGEIERWAFKCCVDIEDKLSFGRYSVMC